MSSAGAGSAIAYGLGGQLDRILTTERPSKGIFATLLSVALAPDSGQFTAVRAGHPGMLVHTGATVDWLEPTAGQESGIYVSASLQAVLQAGVPPARVAVDLVGDTDPIAIAFAAENGCSPGR